VSGHDLHLADERVDRDTLVFRVQAIEAFVEQMHKSASTPRDEAILRRLSWAIRGSNDDPLPPPDALPFSELNRAASSQEPS
jgi:hypothetical protein